MTSIHLLNFVVSQVQFKKTISIFKKRTRLPDRRMPHVRHPQIKKPGGKRRGVVGKTALYNRTLHIGMDGVHLTATKKLKIRQKYKQKLPVYDVLDSLSEIDKLIYKPNA